MWVFAQATRLLKSVCWPLGRSLPPLVLSQTEPVRDLRVTSRIVLLAVGDGLQQG